MRFASSILLALPAIALAQDQVPLGDKLKGWFNKASDFVSSAAQAAPSAPLDAGAAKVASQVEQKLTLENWKSVLTADPVATTQGPQDWVVYIDGGNSTCFGLCKNASKAWNESVALLSPNPKAPKFAYLDCESQPVLCNAWSVGPPSLYYFSIPKPLADQSTPATTAYYIPLNRTSVTGKHIADLTTKEEYKKTEPYQGLFHPFDGLLAQYGLAIPLGYVLWGFGKMPSWLPMILISFFSRSIMGRRSQPGGRPAQGAPAGAAQ